MRNQHENWQIITQHTCTIGNCLIRIDALVEFFSIEKVLEKPLNLWDSGRTTNQDNVVDLGFVQLGIPKSFLHRVQRATEQVSVEFLKASSGDGGVEVNALVERVDLDAGLSTGGQGALGSLTGSTQTPHSPLVVANVLLVLTLKLSDKVIDHAVVEIFTTQMGVTSCGLHLKDSVFNGKDGHVKRSTTEIKDQDVSFYSHLPRRDIKQLSDTPESIFLFNNYIVQ